MFWGVGQTGKWGTKDHRAHAISLEGGVQPKAFKKLKPWFRAGFYDGSGDGNPNDSKHGTFFQVLPTPRPFARFPFFNMMNNRDWMGSLVLRPHAKVRARPNMTLVGYFGHAQGLAAIKTIYPKGRSGNFRRACRESDIILSASIAIRCGQGSRYPLIMPQVCRLGPSQVRM